jgi:hypothetical protein
VSRRRYISTEISVDKKIRRLSDSAALLYTWMVPHCSDDATLTGDPEELAAIVVPNRPGWTERKIAACLAEMAAAELVVVELSTVYFPPSSFYRYQSSIPEQKRRTEQPPANEDFQKKILKVAKNAASPSPSPSPSKHMSDSASDVPVDNFETFWKLYPRKEGKGEAREAFAKALKGANADAICKGLERQLPAFRVRERKFIAMPSTWLNQGRWDDEPEGAARPSPPLPREPEVTDEDRAAGLRVIREAKKGDFEGIGSLLGRGIA